MGCGGSAPAESGAAVLPEATMGAGGPPIPVHQTQMPLEPAIARQTMTLMDKVEKLRAHFGMAKEQPVAAVVATALERLELVGRLEGASVVAKADACIAALASMPAAAPAVK